MVPYTPLVVAANLVTVVFGTWVVRSAYRAHTRTGSGSLRALAAGLGLVTLGAGVGLVSYVLPMTEPVHAIAAQSVLIAAGVVLLARSIDTPGSGRRKRSGRTE